MEDNQHLLPEDADHELEAQISRYVRKVIPVLVATKNTARVLRRLTSVWAQTVEAALEAGTSWFQLKKARNEHSIAQLADLSGGQSAMDVKVAQRLIEEQRRIDQLVFEAIERVQASERSAPSGVGRDDKETGEIDDDWIESFRREAADRSQGEMRETFARILAGEIREPGTFSIKTLRTVGALSQSTANLFRRAASLRVGMEIVVPDASSVSHLHIGDARIPSLGGSLGKNHLQNEGLDYLRLIELTENGLLHSDYDSWRIYNQAMQHPKIGSEGGVITFVHQGQGWALIPLPQFKADSELKIHGAKFTTVGEELLHIVDIESDPAFLGKVRAYLKGQHVEMVVLSSGTS